ncbi:MAG: FkbM family methyltransferase [Crocinitomicaceae bacterium]
MGKVFAVLFRFVFKIPFLKGTYFGFHKRFFKPYELFEGIIKTVSFQNVKFELHIEDWIQQNIYFLGAYERAELNLLYSHLSEDSVFVDIGANFGLYSLVASQKITNSGKIICFEPFPKNYAALKKNISLNSKSYIISENIALGDKKDELSLYYQPTEKNLGMVSANFIENSKTIEVDVMSFDEYVNENGIDKIDFIKIDVEGFENKVIIGMKKTLELFSPMILIEIFDEGSINSNHHNAHDYLTRIGYSKYFIDDFGNLSSENTNPNRKNYFYRK